MVVAAHTLPVPTASTKIVMAAKVITLLLWFRVYIAVSVEKDGPNKLLYSLVKLFTFLVIVHLLFFWF